LQGAAVRVNSEVLEDADDKSQDPGIGLEGRKDPNVVVDEVSISVTEGQGSFPGCEAALDTSSECENEFMVADAGSEWRFKYIWRGTCL